MEDGKLGRFSHAVLYDKYKNKLRPEGRKKKKKERKKEKKERKKKKREKEKRRSHLRQLLALCRIDLNSNVGLQ
jgi:hypothetical protein